MKKGLPQNGVPVPTPASRQTVHSQTALSLDFPETIIDELCQLCLFKSRAEWSDGLSAEGRNSGYF
jgi:hypothetical protein